MAYYGYQQIKKIGFSPVITKVIYNSADKRSYYWERELKMKKVTVFFIILGTYLFLNRSDDKVKYIPRPSAFQCYGVVGNNVINITTDALWNYENDKYNYIFTRETGGQQRSAWVGIDNPKFSRIFITEKDATIAEGPIICG